MLEKTLTYQQTYARSQNIAVHSYDVKLHLTKDQKTFLSTTTVVFSAQESSTFIDAMTHSIESITLNKTSLNVSQISTSTDILLKNLQPENELTIVANMLYTNTGEGLHRFVDSTDGQTYLYSQCEVADARRIFPVFEQPDLKAKFRFEVLAPKDWVVISNSPSPTPTPTEDELLWSFEPTSLISSYIIAIIAGPYVAVHDTLTSANGNTIPLGIYTRKSMNDYLDAGNIFDITKKGFKFFESLFDYPYPFKKYDQIFVPEFNAGAMENAGAVTFTETYIFRSSVPEALRERRVVTILHELAHMWFGNLVTMAWWDDLWLNESFAEYVSTLATAEVTEFQEAWTTFASLEKSWAYKQDQLPTTHPIVANINDLEDVQANFDGITYAKGASVLKQLVAWVGQEHFFQALGFYFKKHEYSNTKLKDLLQALETTSPRSLSSWSQQWLETAGVNTLEAIVEHNDQQIITHFSVEQTAPNNHPILRNHRLAIGFYDLDEKTKTLVRTSRCEVDIDGPRTEVSQLQGKKRPDFILLNDDDLSYTKIRFDDLSLNTIHEHLSSLEYSLARALVWTSLWDSVTHAEMSVFTYLDLVYKHLHHETHSTTLRTVLRTLQSAIDMYVPSSGRRQTRENIANALWNNAQQAPPGSDAQYQFLSAFASTACTEEHVSLLEKLRSREIALEGFDIDVDIEWTLVLGLSSCGALSVSDIDQHLASDDTTQGALNAAHAKASLPNLETKRQAWKSVFDSDELSNALVHATTLGFNRVQDPSILEEFAEAYFDAIEHIWAHRSYKISEHLTTGMFPIALAHNKLLEATDRWKKVTQPKGALLRIVDEHLAILEKALAAQAFASEHS